MWLTFIVEKPEQIDDTTVVDAVAGDEDNDDDDEADNEAEGGRARSKFGKTEMMRPILAVSFACGALLTQLNDQLAAAPYDFDSPGNAM